MRQEEATRKILKTLELLGIPYMITGSIASSAHGMPRSTMDVDIVVMPASVKIDEFCDALQGEFYLDRDTVRDAVARKAHFNLIHQVEQLKIDFWVLKDDDFEQEAFARKMLVDVKGVDAYITTAEDIIVSKLKWMKQTDSQRQREDILGVCRMQGKALDFEYLRAWTRRLGLLDTLNEILAEAGLPLLTSDF